MVWTASRGGGGGDSKVFKALMDAGSSTLVSQENDAGCCLVLTLLDRIQLSEERTVRDNASRLLCHLLRSEAASSLSTEQMELLARRGVYLAGLALQTKVPKDDLFTALAHVAATRGSERLRDQLSLHLQSIAGQRHFIRHWNWDKFFRVVEQFADVQPSCLENIVNWAADDERFDIASKAARRLGPDGCGGASPREL